MARYWRAWRVRLAIGLFSISIVCLFWISNKPYGLTSDFLLQIVGFQGKVALAVSLISGAITAVLQRSFRAGGLVSLGVFFGAMVGGTVGLTSGLFVGEAMDRILPGSTDPYLPNLTAGLAGVAVWFFGQVIGAIWGGADWLDFYTSKHRDQVS